MLGLLYKVLPTQLVLAHCDIPCGIYSVEPARIAAATCLKMTQKITELDAKKEMNSEALNSLVRFIWTKEEHARRCKEELYILWSDYFKPDHLGHFPDLHDKFWNAVKLCSKVKQSVSIETAEELVRAVDGIAEIFAKAEAAKAAAK